MLFLPKTTTAYKPEINIARDEKKLNDTNAVQKWSFPKCRFSTCMGSKIKGKLVYGDIIV